MNKIIKLLTKCILVILPFIAISIFLRICPLWYINPQVVHYTYSKNISQSTSEKQHDILILGDSVSNAAYVPEMMSDNAISLALGAVSPVEEYYILKEYLENNDRPESIFISYHYLHFITDEFFWQYILYSHRLPLKTYCEMYKMSQIYNEESITKGGNIIDILAYEAYFPSKYVASLTNKDILTRYKNNKELLANVTQNHGRYVSLNDNSWEGGPLEDTDFYAHPLFDEYYKKTIELCIENEIPNIHLIRLPEPNTTVYYDDFTQKFTRYYDKIQEAYPEITYTYFDDYDIEFFFDNMHFNQSGAFKFTQNLCDLFPEELNKKSK